MEMTHQLFQDAIADYLVGALSPDDRAAFEAHAAACPDCAALLAATQSADARLLNLFAGHQPGADFEDRLITQIQEQTMPRRLVHPMAKRLGIGIAAALLLGATGMAASYLVARDSLSNMTQSFEHKTDRRLAQANIAGVLRAAVVYGGENGEVFPTEAKLADHELKDGFKNGRYTNGAGPVALDYATPAPGREIMGRVADQPWADRDRFVKGTGVSSSSGLITSNLGLNAPRVTFGNGQHGWWSDEDAKKSGAAPAAPRGETSVIVDNGGNMTLARGLERKDTTALAFKGGTLTVNGTGTTLDRLRTDGSQSHEVAQKQAQTAGNYEIPPGNQSSVTKVGAGYLDKNQLVADARKANTAYFNLNTAGDGTPADLYQHLKASREGDQADKDGKSLGPKATAATGAPTNAADSTDTTGTQVVGNSRGVDYNFDIAQAPANTPTGEPSKPGAPHTPAPVTAPPAPPPASTQQVATQRKVIRSGTMDVEVRSFDDASTTISNVVTEEGGFVLSTSSDKLANGKVRGTIVVRVPPEKLDRFLLKLRALGDIKSQQVSAADVTKQYTDTASELRALRAMEERLINIIKTGKGEIKDLVEAEKQLGDYRVRIEKLEGELRYYDNLVAMSTMTITCYEKDIQKAAAVTETENVNVSLETEEVDVKYRDARKIVDDAKGRIIESELKKQEAGQLAARIVADIPPDKADFVTAQLKQLGTLVRLESGKRLSADSTSSTSSVQPKVEQKDSRFYITMYNLANIAPKRTNVMTIAVPDVEAAYNAIISRVQREAKDPNAPDKGAQPIGRVVSSNVQGQRPEQKTADIRADVKSVEAPGVGQELKSIGEVLNSTVSDAPEGASVTATKTGFQIRLVSLASVSPRETLTLQTAAANVPAAYDQVLALVQKLPGGAVRILQKQINQQDARNVNAFLDVEVPAADRQAMERALSESGVEVTTRTSAMNADTSSTTESKVRYQINLINAEQLPARRTIVAGLEVDNVEEALRRVRDAAASSKAREADYALSTEPSGRTVGRLIVELPAGQATSVLQAIRDLHGDQKVNQVTENRAVADSKYARERIDVTFTNKPSIVAANEGFGATVRSALSATAKVLFFALYFLVIGALVLIPLAILGRIALWLWARRKPVTAKATA